MPTTIFPNVVGRVTPNERLRVQIQPSNETVGFVGTWEKSWGRSKIGEESHGGQMKS